MSGKYSQPLSQSLTKTTRAGLSIAIALCISLSLGCEALTSKAKGQWSNLQCKPDVTVVNNELDAGYKVTLTVKNNGDDGIIQVSPILSTSDGEWSRVQNLQFTSGETKNLTYFFAEPTVQSSNIQCRVKVLPST